MNIFQNPIAIQALSLSDFTQFFKKLSEEHLISIEVTFSLDWQNIQNQLGNLIVIALQHWTGIDNLELPATGLKGIYFCLGDNGQTLDICGSLYFNETDWAANADFSSSEGEEISQLIFNITNHLLIQFNESTTSELMYLFLAFTINKAMHAAKNIAAIANAGISLGYSDGDELILGSFINQQFAPQAKIIGNGEYLSKMSKHSIFQFPTTPFAIQLSDCYHQRIIDVTTPKRIFIVGHMGAGKALLSEALARKLGWKYIDANPSLERYIGRNLNEIFGEQGEEAFHQCEAEIISHYISKEHVVVVMEEAVIATEKNRKLLSSEFVVYLKVSTPMQIERMKDGRSPLLPIADLKAFLDKQHLERDSLFEEVATLTIESIAVEEDVNKIIKTLEE